MTSKCKTKKADLRNEKMYKPADSTSQELYMPTCRFVPRTLQVMAHGAGSWKYQVVNSFLFDLWYVDFCAEVQFVVLRIEFVCPDYYLVWPSLFAVVACSSCSVDFCAEVQFVVLGIEIVYYLVWSPLLAVVTAACSSCSVLIALFDLCRHQKRRYNAALKSINH